MTKHSQTGKVGCGMSVERRLSPLCRCAPKFPSCGGQSTFPVGSGRRYVIREGGSSPRQEERDSKIVDQGEPKGGS